LGKNIFGILANAAGFQVVDIGVDVTPANLSKLLKKKTLRLLEFQPSLQLDFKA